MLTLTNISKTYENQPLLTDVSLTVDSGETTCLLGASGSGKSTLLRIIAGLEPPETGRVLWDGADLAPVPPHARDFGLVFQDYALFPHLTVFDNVAFGLRMRGLSSLRGAERRSNLPAIQEIASQSTLAMTAARKTEISNRVAEMLALVNLRGFESRRVTDLSGGEQQRVALARALAPNPRLLMFDEPLGALDRALKEELLHELRGILRRTQVPAIYVTHDQEEAFAIADRILLLHEGVIVRAGTPAEVWNDPQSAWAARFLDAGNVIIGKMKDERRKMKVNTEFGVFELQCNHHHADGDQVALLLRPSAQGEQVKAKVEDVLFNRDQFKVTLRGGLVVQMERSPKIGEEVSVNFSVECLGHA
jgi:ABC-type Fe3+/spermidine/putrescine transport system ATPase subunit